MWQVQETTLDWLVGLAAATALHLGPAVLPLKSQIIRVLKALYSAPSKVFSVLLLSSCGTYIKMLCRSSVLRLMPMFLALQQVPLVAFVG